MRCSGVPSKVAFACSMIVLFVSVALAADLYVAGGGSGTEPYDTWAKASTTIQAALSNAVAGDTVWVSNGVYGGSMGVVEDATNVAVIPTEVALRSVNGPAVTTIRGADHKRCVYLSGSNTVLDGFTLTEGILTNTPGYPDGGGAYCHGFAQVTNCIVVSNAAYSGGGIYAYAGYVYNCTFEANRTLYDGGGLCCWANLSKVGCVVRHSVFHKNDSGGRGGGVFARHSQLEDCLVYENESGYSSDGGGVFLQYYDSYMRNCLVYSNFSWRNGGGVYLLSTSVLYNCTIVANEADEYGGGIAVQSGGVAWNSIVYGNLSGRSTSNTYWSELGGTPGFYYNCCVAPLTNGADNIAVEPQVEIASGALLGTSPCVDAGTNQAWMVGALDREGHDRIFNGIVDIGCQETFVGVYDMVMGATLQVQWSVPKEAAYHWQWTTDLAGSWSAASTIQTTKTGKVVYNDALGFPERFYRVIWDY